MRLGNCRKSRGSRTIESHRGRQSGGLHPLPDRRDKFPIRNHASS